MSDGQTPIIPPPPPGFISVDTAPSTTAPPPPPGFLPISSQSQGPAQTFLSAPTGPTSMSAAPSLLEQEVQKLPKPSIENSLNPLTPLKSVQDLFDVVADAAQKMEQQGTPAEEAAHPIISWLKDKGRAVDELAFGGQYAGKPMGTSAGAADLANNLLGVEAAPETAADVVKAVRDFKEYRKAQAIARGEITDPFTKLLEQAIPPTRVAPWDAADVARVKPALMDLHEQEAISTPKEFMNAMTRIVDRNENQMRAMIDTDPNAIINSSPIQAVREALRDDPDTTFLERGLKSLERFKLGFERKDGVVDPPLTWRQADDLRWKLNQLMASVREEHGWDNARALATDPGYAAAKAAVDSLRDGVYKLAEDHGFTAAEEMRKTEGSAIRLREAAARQEFNAEKQVAGTAKGGTIRKATAAGIRTAGTVGGAAAGGAVGGGVGAGTGAVIGRSLVEPIARIAGGGENLTRGNLIEKAMQLGMDEREAATAANAALTNIPYQVETAQGGHAGGGVASEEELNRPGRFVKVSRSGQLTDQGKTPDFNLKPGEAGYQVKPDGTFELKAGQETPATKLGIQNYAKEVFSQNSKSKSLFKKFEDAYTDAEEKLKNPDLHPMQRDFLTRMKDVYQNILLNRVPSPPLSTGAPGESLTRALSTLQDALDNLKLHEEYAKEIQGGVGAEKADPKDIVESAGGVFRGNRGGMVEITLPREMTNDLPIQDRMKDFVSITLPEDKLTPDAVKSAMDRKVQEMGGVSKSEGELQPAFKSDSELELPENYARITTPQELRNHEVSHAIVGDQLGLKPTEIVSHLHPSSKQTGAAAQTVFDWSNISKNGKVPLNQMGDVYREKLLPMLMAGGVGQEVLDGTKFTGNAGVTGDLRQARMLGEKLGLTPDEIEDLIEDAKDQARQILTKPGLDAIIKSYTKEREAGLPDTHQMSGDRLQKLLADVRKANGETNENTGNTGRLGGGVGEANRPPESKREGTGSKTGSPESAKEKNATLSKTALAAAAAKLALRPEESESSETPKPAGIEEAPVLESAARNTEPDIPTLLDQAAKDNKVPASLLHAQAVQESHLDPKAVSPKGAQGVMQLEPNTAKALGVTDPFDPTQNVPGGAAYMHELHAHFKSWDKALAAYDWGPDHVQKAIDEYGDDWLEHTPEETQKYVKAIMKRRDEPDYQKSTEFIPTPKDIKMFGTWDLTGPKDVPGMIKVGNIDLTKRPIVHHPDGSVSSLYSGSFPYSELTGDPKDKGEVLVPFVSQDGKMMNVDQAADYARKTGQILGVFDTPEDADAYAQFLHLKQGAFQTWKNGGKYKPTVETWDNWTEKK